MVQRVQELALGYPEGRIELQLIGGFSDPRHYSDEIFYNVMSKYSHSKVLFIFFLFSTEQIFLSFLFFLIVSDSFHKHPIEIDLTLACVGELNTAVRGGIHWPIIYGVGVNIKTGEIFPGTFPDKGPDQALRCARYLTGVPQVSFFVKPK